PQSHSGEPYSNAPWSTVMTGTEITFFSETFDQNANANALRWSTLYNFRFDASVPPATGDGLIGLFRPGTPSTVSVPGIPVPGAVPCSGPPDGDMNLDGTPNGND